MPVTTNNTDWLKESINKIDNKVDLLDSKLDELNVNVSKNTVVLDEHQRRSLANEQAVELLRSELRLQKSHFDTKIKPIEDHVTMLSGALKVFGILSVLISVVTGLVKLLSLFSTLF